MKLVTIIGPTASGKTSRAVEIAKKLKGEIISGDSRQVYRNMDLGTGKDIEEYGDIPYHLIDICNAGEKYNLHRYLKDFQIAMHSIRLRGKNPILCGGTGLYVESALSGITMPDVPENKELRQQLADCSLEKLTDILRGYKELHNITDIDTVKRAIRAIEIQEYYRNNPYEACEADRRHAKPIDSVIIGIEISREDRRRRISERLDSRLQAGMIDEIRNLIDMGVSPDDLIYYGLEYKYLTLFVTGALSYDQMFVQLETAIHQFAKRQMTWFRGMERRGFDINWLPWDMPSDEFIDALALLIGK